MLKPTLTAAVLFIMSFSTAIGQDKPTGLLVNLIAHTEKTNTLINSKLPLFSWIVPGSANGTRQVAYELILSDSFLEAKNGKGNVWTSGKRGVDSSISVRAIDVNLQPSTTYFWRVKTKTNTAGESDWSDIKTFKTADQLNESNVSSEALVKTRQSPSTIKQLSSELSFLDFGKDAFAQLSLSLSSKDGRDTVVVSFGEAIKAGRLDANPGGTVRYQKVRVPLSKGSKRYQIKFNKDQRNIGPAAILMPDEVGEVYPFRYVEVEDYGTRLSKKDVQRDMVHYPFDDEASYFKCSNDTLNQIWKLCKYSIKATSFAGIYVDGNRERIPYEADALINQLGHYGVDREYSMARKSMSYLLKHPTWPTEWILQALIISWNDYLYTGDKQLLESNYEILKNRTLMQLKGNNGLISSTSGLQTNEFAESINFNGKIRDIVDWPLSETDGYVFNKYNAVVNAFYYQALVKMEKIAGALDRKSDVNFYRQESEKLRAAYTTTFLDPTTGLYKDGEATTHSSLHANMFAMSLGLVDEKNKGQVSDFIKSKGMACSVYGSQFLMESLYDGFNGEYARKLLTDSGTRSWYNMIRVGSTITLEAWDNKFKPNQDWNHAWGAAPANIIPRKLMGIEPTSPGFEDILIMPQTGDLEEAEILTPTIRGPISLKISNKKVYTLKVTLPANMRGQVYLPVLEGKTEITCNGKRVSASPVPGKPFFNAGKIESGTWTFTMKQK
ncbi:MAG: alpha-L-rhamnosidase C-terminal domain-containing protein [Pedobacter sp.]